MSRHPRLVAAAVAGGLIGAGTVLAATAAARRWSGAEDPTGGDPLGLPDGERTTITTPDGAELAVTVAGPDAGPTVVLSHCWTGDQRIWAPVARRLVDQGHRVVLYDQRGHGGSTIGERRPWPPAP
ncbi:MAG TPA: alpha/beta fold hydrolase, partial [Acidimicrobiales bacterium]